MLTTDLIINYMGVAGIFLYIWLLVQRWSRTPREKSLFLFLSLVGILLVCRGISWVYNSKLLILFSGVLVSAFPLVYLIYCESLLKRHSPLWLKLQAVCTSLIFFICLSVSNSILYNPVTESIFILFLVFYLGASNFFIRSRDSKELTITENNLADAVPAMVGTISLFFLTDWKPISAFIHQQYGGIGALIVIYWLVRIEEQYTSPWVIGKEIFGFLCLMAVVTFLYYSVHPLHDVYFYTRIASLTFSIILFGMILNQLIFFSSRSQSLAFMKRVVEIPFDSIEQVLKTIYFTGANVDFIIVKGDELNGYDCECISTYFYQNKGKPAKIKGLRKTIQKHSKLQKMDINLFIQQRLNVAEQLIHILEYNEMTHAYVLSYYPLQLLLVRINNIKKREIIELQILLLLKVYAYLSLHSRESGDCVHLGKEPADFIYSKNLLNLR